MSSRWFCVVSAVSGGVVPSAQVRQVARTLSVAVRAAGRPGARGYGHIADSVVAADIAQSRMRRSDGMWRCRRERTVKPSAQPTLVRTQHLPPPAKTARSLRKRGPAGRFLLVTPCIRVCHYGSTCCGVHGRIADGVRAIRTVGAHRRLHGRPRTGPRSAHSGLRAALSRALAPGRECRGWRRPVCQEGCGGGLRSDLLPGWHLVDRRISGNSRAQGGWRRVARPATLREAWRHGMRIAVPRAGRPAVAGAAPHVARTDGQHRLRRRDPGPGGGHGSRGRGGGIGGRPRGRLDCPRPRGLGRRRSAASPRCLHRPACDHRPVMPCPSVTDS